MGAINFIHSGLLCSSAAARSFSHSGAAASAALCRICRKKGAEKKKEKKAELREPRKQKESGATFVPWMRNLNAVYVILSGIS